MTQRQADEGSVVRIDRTIPLWGILTVAGLLVLNVISYWAGQLIYAGKVEELIVTVKAMDAQSRVRETKDVGRDSLLAEHERRITRIENKIEAVRP